MDNSVISPTNDATKKTAQIPLSVKSWHEEDFAIIELAGSLTLSPSLAQLREATRNMLGAQKVAGLILVVSGLVYTDSAGLGELTIVYSSANKRACPLRLVGVAPNLRKMLEMTRLDELLQGAETVAAAKKQMKA
jgi:anti-anti-sigma factor